MFRKIVIVCAAVAAVLGGAIAAPTTASARGFRGGGFRGGGFRGGGWGRGVGLGVGLGLLGAGGYYYGGYPYYGGRGCWRSYSVMTPWGPRLRRVWVCG